MTMSQKTQQERNLRRVPTQKVKPQDKPITGLSPDDDVGVKPGDGTGQPGQIEK
jgi:hypothetical protein